MTDPGWRSTEGEGSPTPADATRRSGPARRGTLLRYWLGGAIASAVAIPFLVLAVTLMYFALRDEKAASSG